MVEKDFDRTLADVRRSYRIVAAYQQRVFHLLHQIREAFPSLSFFYWEPGNFEHPPRRDTDITDLSKRDSPAWCGLPYENFRVFLRSSDKKKDAPLEQGEWFIDCWFVADTKLWESVWEEGPHIDGPDLSKLHSVKKTDSEVWMYVYRMTERKENDFLKKIEDGEWEEEVEQWFDLPLGGCRHLYVEANLAELFVEGGTDTFLKKVKSLLSEEGIDTKGE